MYLSEAIHLYTQQYDNPRSRASYTYVLQDFLTFVDDQELTSITPEQIDFWWLKLRDRGLSPATIAGQMKKIKAFWNWCTTREYVEQSPARFLRISKAPRTQIDKAMPKPVILQLIPTAQEESCTFLRIRNVAILSFLLEYGLRATDAANMTLSGITEDRFITTSKGGKLYIAALTAPIRAVLGEWLELRRALDPEPRHDSVWVNYRTSSGARYQPINASAISLIVRKITKQLGHNYGAHSIRHWKGQSLADARVPPTVVQSILGHSSVSITLEYYYNQGDERVTQVLNDYSVLKPPKEGNIININQTSTTEHENKRSATS